VRPGQCVRPRFIWMLRDHMWFSLLPIERRELHRFVERDLFRL